MACAPPPPARIRWLFSRQRFPRTEGPKGSDLSALQGRHDEATVWFAKSRTVLDEQGASPLRAIADYEEALMYARRGGLGDRERALLLVVAALGQFRTLGMLGWIRRAEALQARCDA